MRSATEGATAAGTAAHTPAQRLADWYERLSPASLAELPTLYAEQARFKDPFNEVQGTAAIARIFEHMFHTVREPRFIVRQRVADGDHAFLTWDFEFQRGSGTMRIHGASHLHFGPDGRVLLHRDYWDAAEELYAKLPLIGGVMRWLQRRLAVPAAGR